MALRQHTKSVTIDEGFAPSRWPTEIHGISVEGKRFERTEEDKTRRDSR